MSERFFRECLVGVSSVCSKSGTDVVCPANRRGIARRDRRTVFSAVNGGGEFLIREISSIASSLLLVK